MIRPSTIRHRWPLIAASTLLLLTGLVVLQWTKAAKEERQKLLGIAPQQFSIRDLSYVEEECTGIGLSGGDDCAGVIVFELPESTALEIQQRGATYFQEAGPIFAVQRWGALDMWQPTPVPTGVEWSWSESADVPVRPPSLAGFLGRHQFMIDVDREIVSDIDDSISSPGSFFARDEYGVMIVAPAKRKVAYAYRN